MKSLDERLDLIESKIKNPDFLNNQRTGNEVGYYIFDYPAEQELYVRERIEYIRRKNETSADNFKIFVFDLYDIMIEILESKGYLEKCYTMEQKRGFEKVSTAVSNLLRVNSTEGLLIDYIQSRVSGKAVIFITGIGKCFPIIRSHTVLNNLHLVINDTPVVLFYPGTYSGQELILFDKIKDDNYYRAFRLVD